MDSSFQIDVKLTNAVANLSRCSVSETVRVDHPIGNKRNEHRANPHGQVR